MAVDFLGEGSTTNTTTAFLKEQKDADFTAVAGFEYFCDESTPATQLIATLPNGPADGDVIRFIAGGNTGGLRIKENATSQDPIRFHGSVSVGDGTGYWERTAAYGFIEVVFSTDDNEWHVSASQAQWANDAAVSQHSLDATARFKAAASSAADDVVIRSEVDTGGAFEGGTAFDKALTTAASAWVTEGQLAFHLVNNGISNSTFNGYEIYTNSGTSTAAHGLYWIRASEGNTSVPSTSALQPDSGTVFEFVCAFKSTSFTGLDANQLSGVEFGTSLTSVQPTKTSVVGRIFVGVDSAGDIIVVTADGTTATVTDTGVNYVANTKIRIKIVYTPGTNVSVTIDDNSPTVVSTNLPVFGPISFGIGKGSSTTTHPQAVCYGGFWRITGV